MARKSIVIRTPRSDVPAVPADRIRIGISSCLLGERVRYDGGHKHDRFLTDMLGPWVEWVPVCPEVEAGLGTPREPVHLVGEGGRLRLVTVNTRIDRTGLLEAFAERRVEALAHEHLSGYVLKKDSPSCGLERVKVHETGGRVSRTGRGIFATTLCAHMPLLPVEEEGRLADPVLRENFIERVFAYRRLQTLFDQRWSVGALVRFHTAHKLTLLSHDTDAYRALGRLVARARAAPRRSVEVRYAEAFMTCLARPATRARHANVLQHMAGHFKSFVDADVRDELQQTITDYRLGLVPLIVPMTLVRHLARRNHVTYLLGQTYLDPHPKELMLRNHV